MAASFSHPSIIIVSDYSCQVASDVFFENIGIQELVGVTVECSLENNQLIYTTKATFHTCDKLPRTMRRVIFRLTAIDGKRYLIGTNRRPYPVIRAIDQFPEKPADSSLKKITITWKSVLPMLFIEE